MALSRDGGDREYNKFIDDGSGNTAVRVAGAVTLSPGSWDLQTLGYTLGVLTSVEYSLLGVTQYTLTLAYDIDGNLETVTKS